MTMSHVTVRIRNQVRKSGVNNNYQPLPPSGNAEPCGSVVLCGEASEGVSALLEIT